MNFSLPEMDGRKIGPLLFQKTSQRGDQQLAAQAPVPPSRRESRIRIGGQKNIRAADDDFIDERIEHAAEDRNLPVAASPKTVEPIGAGGKSGKARTRPNTNENATARTDDRQHQANGRYLVGKLTIVRSSYFAGRRCLAGGRHGCSIVRRMKCEIDETESRMPNSNVVKFHPYSEF